MRLAGFENMAAVDRSATQAIIASSSTNRFAPINVSRIGKRIFFRPRHPFGDGIGQRVGKDLLGISSKVLGSGQERACNSHQDREISRTAFGSVIVKSGSGVDRSRAGRFPCRLSQACRQDFVLSVKLQINVTIHPSPIHPSNRFSQKIANAFRW
jgi:hypothetical protein